MLKQRDETEIELPVTPIWSESESVSVSESLISAPQKSESAPVFDSDSDSGVGVTVCSKLKTIIVEKMFLDFTFFWVKMRLILSIKFKS
jgi:hypothetical protein